MSLLINNSHYRVELGYSVNAAGGNCDGTVVRIFKKRTRQELVLPLPVWDNIVIAVTNELVRRAQGKEGLNG